MRLFMSCISMSHATYNTFVHMNELDHTYRYIWCVCGASVVRLWCLIPGGWGFYNAAQAVMSRIQTGCCGTWRLTRNTATSWLFEKLDQPKLFLVHEQLWLSAPHCNTLHRPATFCNTLCNTRTDCLPWDVAFDMEHCITAPHCTTLHRTATHCNTLQHTATHIQTVCRGTWRLAYWTTTLHCNATHCNTLQHIATHIQTVCRGTWRLTWNWLSFVICCNLSVCIERAREHTHACAHARPGKGGGERCTCMHIYIYMHIRVCACVCVRVCVCVCVCLHMYMFVYMYVCVCVYICIYIYVYVCTSNQ